MSIELKTRIQTAISAFATKDIKTAAEDFWAVLGYQSERRLEPSSYSFEQFQDTFRKYPIRADKAQAELWTQIHLLYQMTDEEIKAQLSDSLQIQIDGISFSSFQEQNMRSYLFVALQLCEDNLSRTRLASITREINRCFAMPVLLLIKTDQMLHISIIYRRRNRIHTHKDVLEKVTIIKDIAYRQATHRAHIEILSELSLSELSKKHEIQSFDQLHKAWEHTLDLKELNKKFYKELSNWFFWASQEVNFPDASEPNPENRNAIGLIRMLTRIIFVWFMKEKGLIPETLFDKNNVDKIIKYEDTNDSAYYKAILQNLFFATLNTEMNRDNPGSRRFRAPITGYQNPDFNVHNLFRYQKLFKTPETVIETYFDAIPFLNGSLFECLDQEHRIGGRVEKIYLDGFSDRNDNPLKVPDSLFWMSQERDCDLNAIYGTKNKHYKVKGLLDILNSYKFTIAENTPIEEEIALDPELLGRVFENLLAAFNPETQKTARNETGSFYTPREIVDFMVNESIIGHLCKALLTNEVSQIEDYELKLRLMMAYVDDEALFEDNETDQLIEAIDEIRIIDPACGSGAFPMGLLLKMVYLLHKLDPNNEKWKARQIQNLEKGFSNMKRGVSDAKLRDEIEQKMQTAIQELKETFANYDLDYSRKLFLIERCIYGVDIQAIAIQISQLRFYISLLVDQAANKSRKNLGIEALPNLETNLLAANTLIPLDLGHQKEIFYHQEIEDYKREIQKIHSQYFSAHSRAKKRELREKENVVRTRFIESIKGYNVPNQTVKMIQSWTPYQSNKPAPFFDTGIMFGFEHFNIAIANPPYIRQEAISYKDELRQAGYQVFNGKSDLFTYFYELAYKLLEDNGIVTFITSNKWMRAGFGAKLRKMLAEETTIDLLIDFKGFQVFENASVDTNIIIFRRQTPARNQELCYVNIDDSFRGCDLVSYVDDKKSRMKQAGLSESGWTIDDHSVLALKDKIERMGKPLKHLDVAINYGIKTGYNQAYIIDTALKEKLCAADPKSAQLIKPVLRGKDIQRYHYKWAGKWVIATFPALQIDINEYPAIKAYLQSFGKRIEQTGEKGSRKKTNNKWFETQDTISYYKQFEKDKIVWAETLKIYKQGFRNYPRFTISPKGYYADKTTFIMPTDNMYYLLGVMNSSLFGFLMDSYYIVKLGGWSRSIPAINLGQIPIVEKSDSNKAICEQIVDLAFKANQKRMQGADTNEIEKKIDNLVYELYHLDKKEIETVQHWNCFIEAVK